ncbi:MAG: PTS sugar transporter subunit IIA [Candidatus Sumerlaeia bacterium]|nr:PTS sugar transporter subunit IIA [Candidatus Sumerlaeia bacterium]
MKVLTVREVADILKLHPRTITKMVRSGEIPAIRIGRVWRFEESVVLEWFNRQIKQGTAGSAGPSANVHLWNGTTRVADLLREDAVQYSTERRTRQEVLEALAALAVRTRAVLDYEQLLAWLIEREQMCPTAFEGGVAFPHPRHPIEQLRQPVLSLLVTRHGVDFGAPDGKPTRVFVLVCSPDDRTHVKILAHLARMFHSSHAAERLTRCHRPADIVHEIQRLEARLIGGTQSREEEVLSHEI